MTQVLALSQLAVVSGAISGVTQVLALSQVCRRFWRYLRCAVGSGALSGVPWVLALSQV